MPDSDHSEDKGFKVVDRRGSATSAPSQEPAPDATTSAKDATPDELLGPIDFGTFLVSLASSALIHLGEAPAPETGEIEPALPQAKQTIDLLGVLQEKTRGNLSPEEDKLLQALLRDLRLRFVNATAKPR